MNTKKRTLLISVMTTALALGAALLTAPATAAAVEGKLSAVENEGRSITVNGKKFKISGSRTTVMIAGKKADREQLKVGMNCKVEGEKEASKVECK